MRGRKVQGARCRSEGAARTGGNQVRDVPTASNPEPLVGIGIVKVDLCPSATSRRPARAAVPARRVVQHADRLQQGRRLERGGARQVAGQHGDGHGGSGEGQRNVAGRHGRGCWRVLGGLDVDVDACVCLQCFYNMVLTTLPYDNLKFASPICVLRVCGVDVDVGVPVRLRERV